MPETEHVSVERDGAVGRVVMNRPDRHNAMTPAMARDVASALETVATDDTVRCIVLTGSGATFNTGADLSDLAGDESDGEIVDSVAGPLHESVRTMASAPKPVVTGINGVVAGGGLGLALTADVAIMAEDARIEYAYPTIGLSGDGGITWMLPRLLGLRRTQTFALLNEGFGADEAVASGLVTESVPEAEFDDRLDSVASDLAAGPTAALGTIRRLLFAGGHRPLEEHLEAERSGVVDLTETSDYRTGIEKFFEDDDPTFEGR